MEILPRGPSVTVIAQLPFRIVNDTRGVCIEYEYQLDDPYRGCKRPQVMREFLGTAENPVQPIYGPILHLMEAYRAAEARIAAFDREREALERDKAELQKKINSMKAQIEGLQRKQK